MSEQPGPDAPDPAEMASLEALIGMNGDLADPDIVIRAMTALHARWYQGWMAAGIPEKRAAQFTRIVVKAAFRK